MAQRQPRILVVDDDGDTCEIVGQLLRFVGADPSCETEPTRALSRALHEKFDAALIDLVMPGLSGFDMLRALKASPYNNAIPVVAMSAYDEYRHAALTDGFQRFFHKPLDVREVRDFTAGLRLDVRP